MKAKEILSAIGDVSDKYIEEAAPQNRRKKKIEFRPFITTAAALIIIGMTVFAYTIINRQLIDDKPKNVIPLQGGIAILADRLSSDDLNVLRELDQNARQEYILSLEKFQILTKDGKLREAKSSTFSVTLSDSRGNFERIFYQISAKGIIIALPFDWDELRFHFLINENADTFIACTDTAVYKINPKMCSATLLSSDIYEGATYRDLKERFISLGGNNLFWTDNPIISPDGEWVVYRSNRSSKDNLPAVGDALWAVNTKTGEEKMISANTGAYQSAQGFVSPKTIVVQNIDTAYSSTYTLLDIETEQSVTLYLPTLPNMSISAISTKGYIALQSYDASLQTIDGTPIRNLFTKVSLDGKVKILGEVEGQVGYVNYSPDGKLIAAIHRVSNQPPEDTLMIFDAETGEPIIIDNVNTNGIFAYLAWAGNKHLILTEHSVLNGKFIGENSWLYTLNNDR